MSMQTEEEYRALAAEALSKICAGTSDSERLRLNRSSSAYLKLATARAEAMARAASVKSERLTPEKLKPAKETISFGRR
jgi:hypothetical protein